VFKKVIKESKNKVLKLKKRPVRAALDVLFAMNDCFDNVHMKHSSRKIKMPRIERRGGLNVLLIKLKV
jgi:hypothetical protein